MPSKFNTCIHGGGHNCRKQGGTGDLVHGPNYMHKHPHALEYGSTFVDIGQLPQIPATLSKSLDAYFEDEDVALELLQTGSEPMSKALYHFDLNDIEGIYRILELLPVLDDEVVRDVYSVVFPNYPVDDDEHFNLRMARIELRGFFMDYLANYGEIETTEDTATNAAGEQTPVDAFADQTRVQSPAGEDIVEPGSPGRV